MADRADGDLVGGDAFAGAGVSGGDAVDGAGSGHVVGPEDGCAVGELADGGGPSDGGVSGGAGGQPVVVEFPQRVVAGQDGEPGGLPGSLRAVHQDGSRRQPESGADGFGGGDQAGGGVFAADAGDGCAQGVHLAVVAADELLGVGEAHLGQASAVAGEVGVPVLDELVHAGRCFDGFGGRLGRLGLPAAPPPGGDAGAQAAGPPGAAESGQRDPGELERPDADAAERDRDHPQRERAGQSAVEDPVGAGYGSGAVPVDPPGGGRGVDDRGGQSPHVVGYAVGDGPAGQCPGDAPDRGHRDAGAPRPGRGAAHRPRRPRGGSCFRLRGGGHQAAGLP